MHSCQNFFPFSKASLSLDRPRALAFFPSFPLSDERRRLFLPFPSFPLPYYQPWLAAETYCLIIVPPQVIYTVRTFPLSFFNIRKARKESARVELGKRVVFVRRL